MGAICKSNPCVHSENEIGAVFCQKLAHLTNSNTFASPTEWRIPEKVAGGKVSKEDGCKSLSKSVVWNYYFFVRARCLSADLRSWVLVADQQKIEPPPAVCQRHKSAAIRTAPRGRLCCLELFWCCCRRLSQHGMVRCWFRCGITGEMPFFCVCLGSWSFCHDEASHCSVDFVSWCVVSLFGLHSFTPLLLQ